MNSFQDATGNRLHVLSSLFSPSKRGGKRTIYRESLLWRREGEGPATASLLFHPSRIIRIRRANETEGFRPDAVWWDEKRNLFTTLPFPAFSEGELFLGKEGPRTIERTQDGRWIHFSEGHYFHDLQITLDYETAEAWEGPVPMGQLERLPRFSDFLSKPDGRTLRLAVLGDSISTGANASGRYEVAPFQPGYVELFAERLRRCVGDRGAVDVKNFSLGGKDAAWGETQVENIKAFKPDLLILAFGMNDASAGIEAHTFAASLRRILDGVSGAVLGMESALISGMSPNAAWHIANFGLREEQHRALECLAGEREHVAFVDIRSVWDEVVHRKGFWSMTGNGVNHPNDFGHQIYEECLAQALMRKSGAPED